jgi:hypothetical protein
MPGTGRITKPAIGGKFEFDLVPEGCYILVLDPAPAEYGPKIVYICLNSGDSMSLDTLPVPFWSGGPCTYDSIPGHATITSISSDQISRTYCDSCYSVKFTFVPDDSTASYRYIFPTWPDTGGNLIHSGGAFPTISYINQNGIAVGNVYVCSRMENTYGACTPVVYIFQGLEAFGKRAIK